MKIRNTLRRIQTPGEDVLHVVFFRMKTETIKNYQIT